LYRCAMLKEMNRHHFSALACSCEHVNSFFFLCFGAAVEDNNKQKIRGLVLLSTLFINTNTRASTSSV
jgi:hypothetical protein